MISPTSLMLYSQSVINQAAYQQSKKAPQYNLKGSNKLSSDQIHFSGRTIAEDETSRQSIKWKLDEVREKITKTERNMNYFKNGAKTPTTLILGIGSPILAPISWLGRKINPGPQEHDNYFDEVEREANSIGQDASNIGRFFSEKKHGKLNDNKSKQCSLQYEHEIYNREIEKGKQSKRHLGNLEQKVKTALQAEGIIIDEEYYALEDGLHTTPYIDEVQNKAVLIKPHAGKIPGFVK